MSAYPWIDAGRNKTWTEREAGDWEACVVTAYAMGLIHGGVKMAAPYTQAEREKLEAVKDSPQDLLTTDAMSHQVYGVSLRKVSTTTLAGAVSRPNIGLVLTGRGSPGTQWQPGFVGLHEVFYVPTSANSGYLGDPLATNLRPFELIAASKILGWATGIGSNQAREVRFDEFAPPPPPKTYSQQELDAAVTEAVNGERARWLAWLGSHP